MSSETESVFDEKKAWETLQTTARRMGEASDPAIYDAFKAQFDNLVADLKNRGVEPPSFILSDPLLRTQFVGKSASEATVDGQPVEVVDELFGMKVAPRAIPSVVEGVVITGDIEIPENVEPPTPQQMAEIDDLLRKSKVAQMRGNREEAGSLLKQAEMIAPYASPVLEAIGDELLGAKKFADARKYYQKAFKVDPKNGSAEKKYADLVFRTDAAKHIYNNLDDAEIVADPKKAALLSYFLPGVGQLVTGSTVKGAIFLIGTIGCAIGAVQLGIMTAITRMASGGGGSTGPVREAHPLAYGLAGIAFILYVVNVADIVSQAKQSGRKTFDRPPQPENLPFE